MFASTAARALILLGVVILVADGMVADGFVNVVKRSAATTTANPLGGFVFPTCPPHVDDEVTYGRLCGKRLRAVLLDVCKNQLYEPTREDIDAWKSVPKEYKVTASCCHNKCNRKYLRAFCAEC